MIRQSTKTDKELMKKYLDLAGADSGSYKLHESLFKINPHAFYSGYKVGTRTEQIKTINKINSFDGIAYIRIGFKGNERVEDFVFMNTLYIYWDGKKQSKRLRKIRKVRSRMIS